LPKIPKKGTLCLSVFPDKNKNNSYIKGFKMKKIIVSLFLATLSGSVLADQTESCGYWEYYNVEVCDERQVAVSKEFTECEYFGGMRNGEAVELYKTYEGNVSCPSSFRGLSLSSVGHFTRTVHETEQYNCRTENRRIWINEGGPGCGFDPRIIKDKNNK